jgi:hypothetical protein
MDKTRASVYFLVEAFKALSEGNDDRFRAQMMGFALVNGRDFRPTREEFLAGCRWYAEALAYAVASGFTNYGILSVLIEAFPDETVFVLLPERTDSDPDFGLENE